MYQYGIVVIGYKNLKAITRLLKQLNEAEYGNEQVLLLISIDYSGQDDVPNYAKEFNWMHGQKIVLAHEKRLGLREHILSCGDYLNTYNLDAIAVFEDDTFPAVDYYFYMKAATEKYINNPHIAGISLYSYSKNLYAQEEFVPINNGTDAYFLQYAQSWGQVWLKKQWNEFKEWYAETDKSLKENMNTPSNLVSWTDSWLKYHIKYCIEKNKYFVYPYVSHSTCFSDVGEHTTTHSNYLQVLLATGVKKAYEFPEFDENALKYDAFFENQGMSKFCNVEDLELEIDLYGKRKSTDKRYLLSSKELDYPIIKSWGNELKAHELNIVYNIKGNDFFLYDLGSCSVKDVSGNKKVIKNKYQQYFEIMDKWLEYYEKQEQVEVESYFSENNISKIAIYGYGKMGKHFAYVAERIGLEIVYILDLRLEQNKCEYQLRSMDDDLTGVDCIVVTPIVEAAEIKRELSERYFGKIMSLEDLFLNVL